MTDIFVFGSNTEGRHGKGAALYALTNHYAVYGQAEGLQGRSYAIITKNISGAGDPIKLPDIALGVLRFLDFARTRPDLIFKVTKIGCGLAGFNESEIKPLFKRVPENVRLPESWC